MKYVASTEYRTMLTLTHCHSRQVLHPPIAEPRRQLPCLGALGPGQTARSENFVVTAVCTSKHFQCSPNFSPNFVVVGEHEGQQLSCLTPLAQASLWANIVHAACQQSWPRHTQDQETSTSFLRLCQHWHNSAIPTLPMLQSMLMCRL